MNKISILGSDINVINLYRKVYEQLLSFLERNDKPGYVTVNNVHTIVTAVRDKKYRQIINDSFLSLPDGKPLSVVAKLKGEKNIVRIFGPTFFEKTIEWGQKNGIKHFLFGSTERIQQRMIENIKLKYPNSKIAGNLAPPFRNFTDAENEEFIEKINISNADLIWISLGAPKQEKWMYNNYSKLKHGVMVGIGAGFNYLAGDLKHAPAWMKKYSLEWLYRFFQEPNRLWKRYLLTNTLFIYYVILDFFKIKRFN
ncbi:putative N-acetylmannosaminyltransferase [bacterium BMS3Abin04]|nr:putative N-acetylmannosaminyltransferase [bacterium BMS3Abin04]